MKKGIIIGVIIAAIVIAGAVILSQDSIESDTTIIITDGENEQIKSKSFEIGLSESVGITEKP